MRRAIARASCSGSSENCSRKLGGGAVSGSPERIQRQRRHRQRALARIDDRRHVLPHQRPDDELRALGYGTLVGGGRTAVGRVENGQSRPCGSRTRGEPACGNAIAHGGAGRLLLARQAATTPRSSPARRWAARRGPRHGRTRPHPAGMAYPGGRDDAGPTRARARSRSGRPAAPDRGTTGNKRGQFQPATFALAQTRRHDLERRRMQQQLIQQQLVVRCARCWRRQQASRVPPACAGPARSCPTLNSARARSASRSGAMSAGNGSGSAAKRAERTRGIASRKRDFCLDARRQQALVRLRARGRVPWPAVVRPRRTRRLRHTRARPATDNRRPTRRNRDARAFRIARPLRGAGRRARALRQLAAPSCETCAGAVMAATKQRERAARQAMAGRKFARCEAKRAACVDYRRRA